MTIPTIKPWESKRTPDTRMVEDYLRRHFEQADAYRYNSASIRVRVIDARFEGVSREQRDEMVEPCLAELPLEIQKDIVNLFNLAPSELDRAPATLREYMLNAEFEHGSLSGPE